MGYLRMGKIPHECKKPRDSSVVKGDIWQCDKCKKRYRCSGWLMIVPGYAFPLWGRWLWPWPRG